jgi:hypothetical protein
MDCFRELIRHVETHVPEKEADNADMAPPKALSRPSALETTKRCIFVSTSVRSGGFTQAHHSHIVPMQKYMASITTCMLTFVRVI